MRLLVGTLHAGENELEECLQAIASQQGAEFEHFLIGGLGEEEAHDALYDTFMRRASEFELFVKVDADMVIESRDLFARIAARMRSLDAEQLAIEVLDSFSGLRILGLHVYRSSVRWAPSGDRVFPDRRGAVRASRRAIDRDDLAPAATHCKNPGRYQSFHFGLHRGIKLIELERRRMRPSRSPEVRNLTWQRFLEEKDIRRGWASLGFELAIRGRVGPRNRDYADPQARALWARHEALGREELIALTGRLRQENAWLDRAFERQASSGASSSRPRK